VSLRRPALGKEGIMTEQNTATKGTRRSARSVVSPPTARSVKAIRASALSAGWQHR
jgi:hypothetical protein